MALVCWCRFEHQACQHVVERALADMPIAQVSQLRVQADQGLLRQKIGKAYGRGQAMTGGRVEPATTITIADPFCRVIRKRPPGQWRQLFPFTADTLDLPVALSQPGLDIVPGPLPVESRSICQQNILDQHSALIER